MLTSLRSKLLWIVLLPLLVVQVAVYLSIYKLEEAGIAQLVHTAPQESERHWKHLLMWKSQAMEGLVNHVWRNGTLRRALNGQDGLDAQQAALSSWNQMRHTIDLFYIWQVGMSGQGMVNYGMKNPVWQDREPALISRAREQQQGQVGLMRCPDGQVRLVVIQPLFVGVGKPLAYAVLGMDMPGLVQAFAKMTNFERVAYRPTVTAIEKVGRWDEATSNIAIELPLLNIQGDSLGVLEIVRSESELHQQFHEAKNYALAMPLMVSVVVLFIGVWFVRWLMQRFYRLTGGLEQISNSYSCNLEHIKLTEKQGDDLDQLEDYFNQMVCLVSSSHAKQRLQHAQMEESNRQLEASLEQVQQAQTQLVQAEKLASLGSMVAGVAHEINTPLGIGYTGITHFRDTLEQTLKRYRAGELTKSGLEQFFTDLEQNSEMIRANLKRAADLVHSFKQVAVDQTENQDRRFDLKVYLEELLLSLQPTLRHTAVTLSLTCPEGLMLYSCPGSFSQVVSNLLLNAVKHAFDEGEQVGCIDLKVQTQQQQIVVTIKDNGCGIAPEHLTRVFDPFFSTKRHAGGTGLGLHVVYNMVVTRLEGTIAVESEVGQGSCFTLMFPQTVSRAQTLLAQAALS
ncbi:sensor histidine kinase [Magnetococcus sp. PR-3]|uniref:sensor histidine kinase n=1 Tax=Magnetococcus sp. PR-3 TaxID=3120355 RepID=UPI002FCE2414